MRSESWMDKASSAHSCLTMFPASFSSWQPTTLPRLPAKATSSTEAGSEFLRTCRDEGNRKTVIALAANRLRRRTKNARLGSHLLKHAADTLDISVTVLGI